MQTTQSTNRKLQTQNQHKYSFNHSLVNDVMIHILTMYFFIIYLALCAILRRAYAVYIAAGVVEAKTAASHRGRTGSRREPLTQVYNSLAT